MKEVRILAIPISIRPYHLLQLDIFDIVIPPLFIIIRALGFLQFIQQNLILIYNFRKASDSIGSI